MESRLPGVAGPVEWLPDSSRFWFRLGTTGGWRFQIGGQPGGSSRDAFDHDQLAAALAAATERKVPPERLELSKLSWRGTVRIEFDFADDRWCWDGQDCHRLTGDERYGVRSPDGDRLAFSRDHDLWVRDLVTGAERRLTDGGRADSFYGRVVPSPLRSAGLPGAGQPWRETAVLWSPDGRRLLTHRIDTAGAGKITMSLSAPLSGAVRPEAVEYLYPLPGDEVLPAASLLIIDLGSGRITPVDIPPLEMYYYGTPIPAAGAASRSMWWRADGESLYLVRRFRGHRRVVLYEVAADGTSRAVVDESAATPIDTNLSTSGPVNHRTIDGQDLTVWYSQRDGWGHLYLYRTSTGELIRRLTSGEWAVADVCHADAASVYFTAVGRDPDDDPYLRRLYRIRLGEPGAQPELLTRQDGSHQISFAPDGSRFLTTWSMIGSAPVTQLCQPAGEVTGTIATADLSDLVDSGWTYPERFAAPARDGQTKVYGVILRPSTFDPAISYPVIDSIYGGPQMNQAPVAMTEAATAAHRLWQAQAIAELGFVVVMIDGLGMPYRSREFRDVSYRNLADAGLPDHISALRSLAGRYPYLDLDRVGIFGHSAGGYASAQAILAHPDFYKVCVSSAGNHDHRLDKASWIERYQGWPVGDHYVEQANRAIAGRLEGKLLLIHGEADENVPVAATLSLADALVAADKDFDLVILPNRPHACGADPYVIRRRWDYFVRHLAGQQPPRYPLRRTP
ncbi:MAG TPA: DPP IV N-terminal domain-containing protein [Streptosporangiaceae bacterium]|jgi:dipeptidyl aminopeptidase/acylaminoacyl peptidase